MAYVEVTNSYLDFESVVALPPTKIGIPAHTRKRKTAYEFVRDVTNLETYTYFWSLQPRRPVTGDGFTGVTKRVGFGFGSGSGLGRLDALIHAPIPQG